MSSNKARLSTASKNRLVIASLTGQYSKEAFKHASKRYTQSKRRGSNKHLRNLRLSLTNEDHCTVCELLGKVDDLAKDVDVWLYRNSKSILPLTINADERNMNKYNRRVVESTKYIIQSTGHEAYYFEKPTTFEGELCLNAEDEDMPFILIKWHSPYGIERIVSP